MRLSRRTQRGRNETLVGVDVFTANPTTHQKNTFTKGEDGSLHIHLYAAEGASYNYTLTINQHEMVDMIEFYENSK